MGVRTISLILELMMAPNAHDVGASPRLPSKLN